MGIREFLEYSRENANRLRSPFQHRNFMRKIREDPKYIGLEKYDAVFEEVYLGDDSRCIATIDLVAFSENDAYLIKASTGRHKNKHKNKLRDAYSFVRNKFDISPHLLVAYQSGQYSELPIPVEDIILRLGES